MLSVNKSYLNAALWAILVLQPLIPPDTEMDLTTEKHHQQFNQAWMQYETTARRICQFLVGEERDEQLRVLRVAMADTSAAEKDFQ